MSHWPHGYLYGYPTRCYRVLERLSRFVGVLPWPEVKRLIDRFADKHRYPKDWIWQHAFNRAGLYRPVFLNGRAWYGAYMQCDITLDVPLGVCEKCGKPCWRERSLGRYGATLICEDRRCKSIYTYWYRFMTRHPRAAPRGDLRFPYLVAEFIVRMAKPKSEIDMQFAKRYAHRRTA